MATVPDLSGNTPDNAPIVDEHIPTLLEQIEENTAPV